MSSSTKPYIKNKQCPICKEILIGTNATMKHYYQHQLEGMAWDDRYTKATPDSLKSDTVGTNTGVPSKLAELRLLKSIGSFSEEQMKIITAYHSQALQRTVNQLHEHAVENLSYQAGHNAAIREVKAILEEEIEWFGKY